MGNKLWNDASTHQAITLSEACSGHWLPVIIERHNNEVLVKWCLYEALNFKVPFMQDSIRQLGYKHDLKDVVRFSSTEFFEDFAHQTIPQDLTTEACIFHISRCGSTLVCNVLKESPESLVLSEPQPLDFILRQWACHNPGVEQQERLLEALFNVWNFVALQQGQKLFVKPDCWLNLHWQSLLKATSINISWLLTRDLSEVLLSHKKRSGAFMLPQYVAPEYFGLEEPGNDVFDYSRYPLQVLSKVLQCGLNLVKNGRAVQLDFETLVSRGLLRLLNEHQISLSQEKLQCVLASHSKNGGQFVGETTEAHQTFSTETLHRIQENQRRLYNVI
ncbi:hypothetical protein [Planctobacterium marinum]|uniref:Sulfotransferase family protein n=1 Tax=Planctobacterium marinum TaxID=1631968 RepID=A0AA48KTV7_9ALTE|nr:hypothetical protein MACH26_41030 [Planctobacterium marinum]